MRQGYGLTECASVVTLDDGDPAGARQCRAEHRRERRPPRRRWRDPDRRAAVPRHGRHTTRRAGPLATGDIGRIDAQGRLWIEGRKSALIVTSHGRNVSPEWVEGALTAQPAILQAMVRGDGRPALDALIVPASPDADVAAAVAATNALLPEYARVARIPRSCRRSRRPPAC